MVYKRRCDFQLQLIKKLRIVNTSQLNSVDMKSTVLICVLSLAGLALARPGDDHYTDRWDNIDLKEIMSNTKLFDAYFKCLMDLGKCTAEGKELKSHMTDALENECAKCTEKQKDGVKFVIKELINNKEDYWKQLTAKYDPENKYRTKYEEQLREVKA